MVSTSFIGSYIIIRSFSIIFGGFPNEFEISQSAVLNTMQARVPALPADAGRWIGEMEEIAKTFAGAGVTPKFHEGAAEIFDLLASTPFATETRETVDSRRSLADAIRVFAETLDERDNT